jgi:outer membrane protein TolC
MIQKTEVLYIDVRVKEIENQIAYAKSNIKNASDYLYFLLDEESFNKVFKPTEKLEFQNQILENTATLNVERKDLQAYQKSLEAYDYLIKSTKAKFLPRLNALEVLNCMITNSHNLVPMVIWQEFSCLGMFLMD